MNKIVKEAIDESWRDYQNASIGMDENENWAHEHGWKDGYEWILTELKIEGKISEETFKEYITEI